MYSYSRGSDRRGLRVEEVVDCSMMSFCEKFLARWRLSSHVMQYGIQVC